MKKTPLLQKRAAALVAFRKAADDHLIAVRGLPTFRAMNEAERKYMNAVMAVINDEIKTEKVKP